MVLFVVEGEPPAARVLLAFQEARVGIVGEELGDDVSKTGRPRKADAIGLALSE